MFDATWHWAGEFRRSDKNLGAPWTEIPMRLYQLAGDVHAEGLPTGSSTLLRIDTEQLHLDMTQHIATSQVLVKVNWGGDRLDGHGMYADLKNDTLTLSSKVHGVLFH